jgi:hypothetical protein
MKDQWTDALQYEFTAIENVPSHILALSHGMHSFLDAAMDHGYHPSELLTVLMQCTVDSAVRLSIAAQLPQGELLKMVVHYFMDAMKHHAPEQMQ